MDKQEFRNQVWATLLVDSKEIYQAAREQENEINALIDQGYEANWDAESIATFIKESAK